jgi:hypothetical protein
MMRLSVSGPDPAWAPRSELTCTVKQKRLAIMAVVGLAASMGSASRGWSAAPILYRQPANESPTRGEPDDLLLIPGFGFNGDDQVVYQLIEHDKSELTHPLEPPRQSTSLSGTADVVSFANIPYSLTVRLPKSMREDRAYALWVVTAGQEWSEPVRINDARPLWVSPAVVYSSASIASLPRYVKVVGRNLQPALNGSTEIRLLGPAEVILNAAIAAAENSALDRYVALAPLPATIAPGTYRVQVRRDRSGWTDLAGQLLEVRPDPPPSPEFKVSAPAYGGCKANDGVDDAPCVERAIAAAESAGGGTVTFGPGTWNLSEMTMTQPNGILVPRGVHLRGAGKFATTIVQNADGKPMPAKATFTLLGGNRVEGMTFRDAHVYGPKYVNSTFIQLGPAHAEGASSSSTQPAVTDIVITQNVFDRPNVAIKDGGAPISRLFITYNEFGAYRGALELAGNRYLVNEKFAVEDAVIEYNLFKPGSYLETDIRQGTMASEIGASLRMDFSHNTADGAATDRLYSVDDAHGWRAAFFWHMNNNQEMLLVSQNVATCTGDKAGDGEAISYDNNANTFGLARAAAVLRATADSITISGSLAARQNDRDIRISNYYQGHWIQVGDGPGLGQVRKIRSYTEDPSNDTVTFLISPNWDVVPQAAQTRVSIGREFWQVYTIANTVDHRRPPCLKSNRTSKKGGGISIWAQNADSVVEGNRQYDTDGIVFQQYYNAEEESCSACGRETFYVDFLEIRGNTIDGEYDWDDGCSSSGILGSIAIGPTPHSVPPTASYGLSISHNSISDADATQGGAISLMPTWYQGPPPNRWPFVSNTLIFHNELRGLDSAPARACKGGPIHVRTGISLGTSALVSRSVLYSNSCGRARRPLDIRESETVRVCPAGTEPTCECTHP